ncbi:MBL fold metallo-hydrolase [Planococcus salinus]|uniref:MBL fold metallo-hydrolase n=2 Tax=Planococcus salinus TaxID=1848460 RepID=A0A3M8P7L0_9BACL|nr:MBL fold metallo-hydrolase [Planococcus salinus]
MRDLGITPIRVELPFRLNHVNCFMAEGIDGWTVIDTGLNNDYTRELWEEQIGTKEISDLLLTHYHPDHFGHAGSLQKKTGAKVSMSKTDALAGLSSWQDEVIETIPANYRACGIPEDKSIQMTENTAGFQDLVFPLPEVDRYFKEGESVVIGRYEYEVIFTPGHSDGMVCFYNKEQNVLFSADHILPKITPNISYWFHGDENPLKTYYQSLEKMKELDAELVIPSHHQPFYGANKRIDELMKHHNERLEETLDTVTEGRTVYEACEQLFKRPLTVHETRFAVGETLAHLEFLRHSGDCGRRKEGEQWIYQRA